MDVRRALILAALAANAAALVATSREGFVHRSPPLTAPFALDPDSPTVELAAEVWGDEIRPTVVVSVRADNADGEPPAGVSVWVTADGEEPVELEPEFGLADAGVGPAALAVTYYPVYVRTPATERDPARVTLAIDLVGDGALSGEVLVATEIMTVREFDDPPQAAWVTP